jgi:hypothetical protein
MSTSIKPALFVLLSVAFLSLGTVSAQQQMRGEFIESSSPTTSGGNVTTRAEPGRRVQTTITVPRNATPRVASNPNPAQKSNSILDRSGSGRTISAQRETANDQTSNSSAGRYPYPAQYSPRVAANPYQPNPNANRVNAARPQFAQNNCQCTPVPVNGLGLTPVPVYNNTTGRPVAPTSAFQQGGFGFNNGGALVGQGVQPVMSQAPQIQYQVPGQVQVGAQPFAGGQIGVPQFGTQQRNWTQSPWLAGTPGAYRPLVGIFNMPQGSFLGQGIIGQPEAYVNGQPIANFMRYLFPF